MVAISLSSCTIVRAIAFLPSETFASSISETSVSLSLQEEKLHQGIERFQYEDYERAIALWEEAIELDNGLDNSLTRALLFSNLSLAHQHLSELEIAKEYIKKSLETFNHQEMSTWLSVEWDYYAKALNTLGWLHLQQGYTQKALDVWQYTAQSYVKANNTSGIIGSQLNQAQALQSLGLSAQAREKLARVRECILDGDDENESCENANVSPFSKVEGLRQLGNALRRVGELDESAEVLEKSLGILAQVDLSAHDQNLTSDLFLDMGNTHRAQWERAVALDLESEISNYRGWADETYEQAIAAAVAPRQKALTQTNQLGWWVIQYKNAPDEMLSQKILASWSELESQFEQLSLNRYTLQLHLQSIDSLLVFNKAHQADDQPFIWTHFIAELEHITKQAKEIEDRRSQSLALGYEGHIYELIAQDEEDKKQSELPELPELSEPWAEAMQLTRNAIALAEYIRASDIQYRWEWQLGRLLKATNEGREICKYGEEKEAIEEDDSKIENEELSEAEKYNSNNDVLCTYEQAINTLAKVRKDLLFINSDVQFSFRDNVEPLYREYIDLLLSSPKRDEDYLRKATELVDALQLAELENFLGCNLESVQITKKVVDPHAAIIYPIVLDKRLDVITVLPSPDNQDKEEEENKQLFSIYELSVSDSDIENLVKVFRQTLANPNSRESSRLRHSEQLYSWLIYPFESQLEEIEKTFSKNIDIETLVFVLDGDLRNIPMAALWDQERAKYLVEQYAIAVAPSLALVEPKPMSQPISTLAAGTTESLNQPFRDEKFVPLENVKSELEKIDELLPTRVLLDKDFNRMSLKKRLQEGIFSIIHIATHGEFSSDASRTFIAISHEEKDENNVQEEMQQSDASSYTDKGDEAYTDANNDVENGSTEQPSIENAEEDQQFPDALFANELDTLLRDRPINSRDIELLVLSACKTAEGDNRATLGIAGLSIRAGARSTLATLWSVYDKSASQFMQAFYTELADHPGISRAKALQNAQIEFLQTGSFEHPSYWAAYIMVGNWL